MPDRPWPLTAYERGLLVLTAATGAIDGVSYLALDRVFTGNMTGNVLFIGFGLVGAADIPLLNNVVALLAFMLGAALGGRLAGAAGARTRLRRRTLLMLLANTGLVLVLGAVWVAMGRIGTPAMVIITGLLALLLGAQAAGVKQIGIRDLSTVVVTMTMVNLSTDSRVGGGRGEAWLRRTASIVTMGLGALAAALVTRQLGGSYALLLAGTVMLAGVLMLGRARRLDALSGADARVRRGGP